MIKDDAKIEITDKEMKESSQVLKDILQKEISQGNIVLYNSESFVSCSLDEFIKQPTDSLLYDLNRCEEVCLAFMSNANIKWVNDYAVAKVIRKLKSENNRLENEILQLTGKNRKQMTDIIDTIKIRIKSEFPQVDIKVREQFDSEDYFILIDSQYIYESDEYQAFIMAMSTELLNKKITNIFFSCL